MRTSLFWRSRGFTLVELLMAMAVLAVVTTLAVPSFSGAIERARLRAAAENFKSEFEAAKREALRTSTRVHYSLRAGQCHGFRIDGPCDCALPAGEQACTLSVVRYGAEDSARLVQASTQAGFIDPVRGFASAPATLAWQSTSGYRLQARLWRVGRLSLCSPAGAANVSGYPSANCEEVGS